jgi:hypothetical protein
MRDELRPNRATIAAMKAAERGEVTATGRTGANLVAALQASPHRDIDIEPERYRLHGEDWLAALLLAMVIDHCAGHSPEKEHQLETGQATYFSPDPSSAQWLNSYNSPANAAAMRELEGELEIVEDDGARILAKLTPEGRALLDRLRAEQQRQP